MIVAMPIPPPMHSVMSAVAEPAALELVERGAEEHRAGRAERVAERDGAAVDVDPSPGRCRGCGSSAAARRRTPR
jgi:hypothetical protein